MKEYTYKTTKMRYSTFKLSARNPLHLAYLVFLEETDNKITYDTFRNKLTIWLLSKFRISLNEGLGKINIYLDSKLA